MVSTSVRYTHEAARSLFPWRARVLGGGCLLGGRPRVLLEQRLRHADAVDRGAHDPARVARALAGGVEAGQAGAPGQ